MKYLLIGFLCMLSLASCKKQNNFDPAFAVITKEPLNVGADSAFARGAIISIDQVYIREKGFIWHSLTNPASVNRMSMGGNSQPGDFGMYIHYQSSVQKDSFKIRAYAVTNNGDSMAAVPIKFYTP
jgi:hypothetical protein